MINKNHFFLVKLALKENYFMNNFATVLSF